MFRRLAASLVIGAVTAAGLVMQAPAAQAAATPSVLTPSGGQAGGNPVVLSWDRPPGAAKFEVQVSTDPTFAGTPLWKTTTVNDQAAPTVQLPAGEVWWRVGDATSGTPTEWASASFVNRETERPTLVRPLDAASIQPPEDPPRFDWEPVPGAVSYTIQISRDELFVDPNLILGGTFTTTAVVITAYQAKGTYFWRVRANLTGGVSSAWSSVRRYGVEGLTLPHDPVLPELAEDWEDESPPEFPVIEEVVLDWDAIPGAVAYQLQVSTDQNFLSVVHKHDKILGTRYSPPGTLDNDEYYWRIRPVDAAGNVPDWPVYGAEGAPKGPWRFRRAWDDQPTLVHPADDSSVSGPFFYEWTAVERASTYEVQLIDSVTGEVECRSETVHTTLANKCVPGRAGTFSWKVMGIDEGGTFAPETEIVNLPAATFTYTPPPTPTAGGPFDVDMVTGHTSSLTATSASTDPNPVCQGVIGTCLPQTPVLSWNPVPGATYYKVTVALDAALTNRLTNYRGVSVNDPLFTFKETLPDSQAGAPYYWIVQPCSTTCAPLEPAKVSFAKRSRPVTLLAPVDNKEHLPELAEQNDITFDWTSELETLRDGVEPGEPVPTTPTSVALTEAKTYKVQVATSPAFGTADVVETQTVDQTTFTSFAETYPEGNLYWRVSTLDGSGLPTVWSDTWTFVKRSPVPVPTGPTDGGTIAGDLTLTWDALDYAKAYEIEIVPAAGGAPKYYTTVHTSWAPEDPFPVSSNAYSWRVRRIDGGNRKGDWSHPAHPAQTFRIGGVVPALTSPSSAFADGSDAEPVVSPLPPNSTMFTWLPDARASKYRWELRKRGTTSLTKNVVTPNPAWAPVDVIPGGDWQWRVVALDAKNSTPLGASEWWGFRVSDTAGVDTHVAISGTGKVGTDLEATVPRFTPSADQVTYQWYRDTSRISGATSAAYTVATSDVGKAITVRATGKRSGYQDVVSTSNAITGRPGEPVELVTPAGMRGTPAVGSTLEVVPGVWEDGARISYQWYRNGSPISRADDEDYTLGTEDAGRRIHVVEKATLSGRQEGTSASTAVVVRKLRSATTLKLSSSRPTTAQRITATGTVNVSGISSPGGTITFYDGRRKLGTVRLRGSTAALRLPALRAGRHALKAVYSGGAQALGSTRSVGVRVSRPRR